MTLPGQSGTVTDVAAGQTASYAVTSSGQLYAFGNDYYGQLGREGGEINPTPTQVTLPGASGGVTQVAAGSYSVYALTASGQLYSFGANNYGQLGNATNSGTGKANPTPTEVTLPGATGVVAQIAAGAEFGLALTSTNQLFAWGSNEWGQLGNMTNYETSKPNPTPTIVAPSGLVGGTGPITAVAAGYRYTLAATSTGQLYGFGENGVGQLGNTDHSVPQPTPTLITLAGPLATFGTGPESYATAVFIPSSPPVLSGVSPDAGLTAGGATVTITGTGLEGAREVRFGSKEAHVTADTATSITAVSPAAAGPETVNVTVETGGGESASSSADDFTYVAPGPAPTITKLSSKKGPARGGTPVTITGTGFAGVTSVKFGASAAASYTVTSPTSIAAVSPPGTTGTVNVTVTTPNGESAPTSKDHFAFEAPIVTDVSPNSGSAAGGYEVTVEGTGFALGSATTFKFGKGAATEVDCISTNLCTMHAPGATKAGTVDILAKAGGKTSKKTPADHFTYA